MASDTPQLCHGILPLMAIQYPYLTVITGWSKSIRPDPNQWEQNDQTGPRKKNLQLPNLAMLRN